MMLRIAWRSLVTRPVRTAVLAAGFGFGVAVMAELLGVGHIMVEQARAPALQGGGDLVVSSGFGSVQSARFVTSTLLGIPDLAGRIRAVSPSKDARLFLVTPDGPIAVVARGGIPSLEKAVGDPEVSAVASWTDAPGDDRWSRPAPGDILRAMDRFHPIPDVPARAASWAEWLYFNGRTRDGRVRFYLTFLVGPRATTPGKRVAGVRLQLKRDGRSSDYAARGLVDEASLLAEAPDLEIAGNRVRLQDLRYRITLALYRGTGERGTGLLERYGDPSPRYGAPSPGYRDPSPGYGAPSPGNSEKLTGEIVLDAAAGRSVLPATIRGANGWVSGYVVPVLSGTLGGALTIARETLTFDGGVGYHDHNWGFWEGVSWQWGQVAHDDLSIVYWRVFPPADVADAARIPGFLAVLGREGLLGFSTEVVIDDHDPRRIEVRARGRALDVHMTLAVEETVQTAMAMTGLPSSRPMKFLQLGGEYHVAGRVVDRDFDFTARGAAETFRPQ